MRMFWPFRKHPQQSRGGPIVRRWRPVESPHVDGGVKTVPLRRESEGPRTAEYMGLRRTHERRGKTAVQSRVNGVRTRVSRRQEAAVSSRPKITTSTGAVPVVKNAGNRLQKSVRIKMDTLEIKPIIDAVIPSRSPSIGRTTDAEMRKRK